MELGDEQHGQPQTHEDKLRQVLEAFLQPTYQIRNECYLNGLLSHLAGKEDAELGVRLLKSPSVTGWVQTALTLWETTAKPSISVSTFTLNLVALLSRNEEIFNHYTYNNVYTRLFNLFNSFSSNIAPTLKLASIKILTSFLEHKSGIEWIVAVDHTDYWKACLNFCLANQTVYIIREGHSFIFLLLTKCIECNAVFVDNVVRDIMSRFTHTVCSNGLFPNVEDESLQKQVRPTLKLLTFIFDKLLESELFVKKDFRIAELFIKSYNFEAAIDKIVVLTRNRELLFELYSALYHVYIFELPLHAQTEIFPSSDITVTAGKIFSVLGNLINSREIVNVVKLSSVAEYRWKFLKPRFPPVEPRGNKAPLTLENQLMVLQSMPIFGISFVHCHVHYSDVNNDDVREEFMVKVFNMMCESTIRICYNWRETITEQPDAFENGKLAMMITLKSIKSQSRDRAIYIVQILIYSLSDILKEISQRPESVPIFTKNHSYLILLLEALAAYIDQFDVTWRESVETICITSEMLEFLKHNFWPCRVVVKSLKVLNVSIAKFLSPNLALLLDPDIEAMSELMTMLNMKLLDIDWEVRDSALEVVTTIANISNTKYPIFQTMLMNEDVVKLVVTMAVSDGEAFVRAAAIKCLQDMIQVPTFWSQVLVNQELPQKLMNILRNETEAIVRTEAACLMRCIHEHQSFPNELMDEIYESMAFAVTSDLHWEVKLNALGFWGKVILNHLQDQGFLDGKFPHVTFSKEHRKIVTLTEKEIKTRLDKVLKQLSRNGCLGVLVHAIQDECDIEVSKKSLVISKKVAGILDRYDLPSLYGRDAFPQSPVISGNLSSPPLTPQIEFSDTIIDQIINSDDISLLANVYNPNYTSVSNGIHNSLKVVTPEMFVNFLQTDLETIVNDKVQWLNKMDDLDSLLDDMLKTYEGNLNSMDCY